VLSKGAVPHSVIDRDACRGCGVCVAACPAGAISQPRADRTLPDRGEGLLVFACGRADLTGHGSAALPERVTVRVLPCAGGVDLPTLLGALARGFDGVLVLGRHQSTCRLDGAEAHSRDVVRRADELAVLCGLGGGRVVFAEPGPGRSGPLACIEETLAGLTPTPLRGRLPADHGTATLADAFALMAWLGERPELRTDPASWLDLHELPAAVPGAEALDAGAMPYLDIAMSGLLRPADLGEILRGAIDHAGEPAAGVGVSVGPLRAAAGVVPSREDVRRAIEDLAAAGRDGASSLEVGDVRSLIAHLMAQRTGAWRRTHVRPAFADRQVSR